MNLRGMSAIVTGGAVRIGRAICRELADRGCRVVIHYHRSADEAEALAAELTAGGGAAYCVRGRLWNEADCEAVIGEAWACCGGLDILVNNASVFHKQTLLDADEAAIEHQWRVNSLVPMLLTRHFARRVLACEPAQRSRAGADGRVVNLLDRRIASHEVGSIPYVLSKSQLADYTRKAALELAPRLAVNGVAPGAILPPSGGDTETPHEPAGDTPLDYACTPADVARAVAGLLEADGVTGQIIFVDSGQHLL